MGRNTTIAIVASLVLLGAVAGAAGTVAGAGSGTQAGVDAPASAQQAECGFTLEVEDATGETVTIEEEPQRVVTTNPSAAQTMKEIGAWDKVVGVTQYAAYLEGADQKANVSGASGASVERVIEQEPDLVLVPNATFGNQELVQSLRDADLTVYHFAAAEDLDDIRTKTLLTGELVGACDGAEEAVGRMDEQLAPVEEAVADRDGPRVLYVMGPSGYVAGTGTFIHTAIEAAGGENLAEEAGIAWYQEISEETVAEQDPEWIVKPAGVELPDSAVYEQTTAVQEGNVLEVDSNHISQPAPRIVDPIRVMAEAFHAEAFATATPTATATSASTDEPTPTATPTESPGFGLAAALLALLSTLVLARRR